MPAQDRARCGEVEDVVLRLRNPIGNGNPPEHHNGDREHGQEPHPEQQEHAAIRSRFQPRHGRAHGQRERETDNRHDEHLPPGERETERSERRRGARDDARPDQAGDGSASQCAEAERRCDDQPRPDQAHDRREERKE